MRQYKLQSKKMMERIEKKKKMDRRNWNEEK